MRSFSAAYLNDAVDPSRDFGMLENQYFFAKLLNDFDCESGTGSLKWQRHARKIRMSFNNIYPPFEPSSSWEFPAVYPADYGLPFQISFVSPRTVRLRCSARQDLRAWTESSPLLAREPAKDTSWKALHGDDGEVIYKGMYGSVRITKNPFRIEILDGEGKRLTQTYHFEDTKSLRNCDPIPFSLIRRSNDLRRSIAATTLAPNERIYGGGESFTGLNKRGQKLVLWTKDANGAQSSEMHKPIPFMLSSRGYGMFVHSSAPVTFDIGSEYDGANTIYAGDEKLDLFIFLGKPKQVLEEYTSLTGRSPVPPIWSFGLWMSRISYNSEDQVRAVADNLRDNHIPCDVIHIDTGWFERNWECDFEFSPSRFPNAEKLLHELRQDGFRISLWQLPYFTPGNPVYQEIIDRGLAVTDARGSMPTDDAILDFSNPEAVAWIKAKLEKLLRMGVAAIKADFGEAAPLHGLYASGRDGFFEHNLYPLRYNKALYEITEEVHGEALIWGRSAWAGSQRYPVHWSGDAENTDAAMLATLRSGLSLGLSGFTFWSHDIGGFTRPPHQELYARWLAFGMFTSHSRTHGAPPREPWEFGEDFLNLFRRTVEMRYRLIPYIYTQSVASAAQGLPLLRAMFLEYPEDPTAWLIEDQYMFGTDLLVGPLFEENIDTRNVYLPAGQWIDYQTDTLYEGGRRHRIKAGELPIIVLVCDGAAIPHAKLAPHTGLIDWNGMQLKIYTLSGQLSVHGLLARPGQDVELLKAHKLDGCWHVDWEGNDEVKFVTEEVMAE